MQHVHVHRQGQGVSSFRCASTYEIAIRKMDIGKNGQKWKIRKMDRRVKQFGDIEKNGHQWRIRKMDIDEWKELVRALQTEADTDSCNYSEEDGKAEFTDQCHLYAAEDEQTGQLLAFAVLAKHGKMHACIGGCCVHSCASSAEITATLLSVACDSVPECNIIIDFPSASLSPLADTGILQRFNESGWTTLRYTGVPSWQHIPSTANQQLYVCHAQMMRLEDIAAFDHTVTALDRTDWLRHFLRHSNDDWIPRSVQLVVTNRSAEIRGYGCVRPGKHAARIGPIYARDSKTFLLLFRSLMGSCREARTRGVQVAVCSANRQAVDMLESVFNLQRLQLDEKRMCTKWHPRVAWEQVYCMSNCITQYV